MIRSIAYPVVVLALWCGTSLASWAQDNAEDQPPAVLVSRSEIAPDLAGCDVCGQFWCTGCAGDPGFFGGADFLLIQPHFSEAIAFASGTQTPTSFQTRAVALDFDYDASFRAFFGYRPRGDHAELRFTYANMQGEVNVNGSVSTPGQFIVDPFGNVVGAVAIIDPSDARGVGFVIVGGDRIATRATVDLNVYDLDLVSPVVLLSSCWGLTWSAGLRVADVDQYYQSTVTNNAGAFVSGGDFFATFVGGGPRLGLQFRRLAGRIELVASGHASLLVGDYDVGSSVVPQTNPPQQFMVEQFESMPRLLPVIETEVGASWAPTSHLTLSAGWLFQAWYDLGTSGGTFGGFFTGADDANIMSFDGLQLRGKFSF